MEILELEISSELLGKLNDLATLLYGDAGQDSIDRTLSDAISMRLHWLELSEDQGRGVEEAVAQWESQGEIPTERASNELGDWLFERRK